MRPARVPSEFRVMPAGRAQICFALSEPGFVGIPNGIRTRAAALKGRCPRPLDDGDLVLGDYTAEHRRDRGADRLSRRP